MKLVIFDTETSGLPEERNQSIYSTHKWPHIIQLAYIVFDTSSNKIIEHYESLVQLNTIQISKESIAIHNITNEMCMNNGLPILEVLSRFICVLSSADMIIGHNIDFDINMICVECIRNSLPFNFTRNKEEKPILKYCTMMKGKTITNIETTSLNGKKYIKYPKLIELYKHYFKEELAGLHNALIDVLACFRCYYKMEYGVDRGIDIDIGIDIGKPC
jgi:DNA polymerase III epsilon subunit-like protein